MNNKTEKQYKENVESLVFAVIAEYIPTEQAIEELEKMSFKVSANETLDYIHRAITELRA